MAGPIRALLATLRAVPRFDTRPPCADDPRRFDLYTPGETPQAALDRWRAAAEVCLGCPFMAACAALVDERVEGVVAARVCGLSGLTPQPPEVLVYVGPGRRGRGRYRVAAAELKRRSRAVTRRKAAQRAAAEAGAA